MLELARELLPVLHRGEPVAVVVVTRVARSAPRGEGASMAVTAEGRVIGSISGGCVEGDAVVLAHTARFSGAQTARLGFSDDAAHAAGLACGGSVEVIAFAVAPDAVTMAALEAAAAGRAVTVGITAAGRVVAIDGGFAATDAESTDQPIVVLSVARAPRLIILGASEHAVALCRIGAAAGFAVTVCDVWETLATHERFPDAAEIVVGMPHELLAALDPHDLDANTAVCVLTHDERLDVPALAVALRLPVGFVGAMGARGTVAHRARMLRDAGVSEIDLARLHSPLGLDLGGRTPDETALSVLAEIVASRHGGSGAPLRERDGAIHRERRPDAHVDAARSCAASIAFTPDPAGAAE
ncbi:XdhC/CoxI family protein [Microbacterium sp. 2FI]|uniref:XdhC family protein n=1 Tax=Microbacterium sp. 2FI TaxID=2502193 RepID=UPI0010F804D0|nr:XdhC/CoxI family protein [Microbacterium sp. 2FI]